MPGPSPTRPGPPGRPLRADLPAGFRLALDPALRRIDGSTVLVGGSPLRLLRLTASGRDLVDRLAAGDPVPGGVGAQRLARRLLDIGMAHPRPGAPDLATADVTVVVPVRDATADLSVTLARLSGAAPGAAGDVPSGRAPVDRQHGSHRHGARPAAVVVVDDGSVDPHAVARVVAHHGAVVIHHDRPRGPGGARNTGWRAATTPVVAFVDAGCEPSPGWLPPLLGHLRDPSVAGAAPRITSLVDGRAPVALAAYDATRSPLDRGAQEAPVRPRGRVPFIPTATLVVRRAVLEASGGFDEGMAVGEDVDLAWRLSGAGWTIRYEPASTVGHPPRPSWGGWLRQRYAYGTSAAPLARRHGPAVAPLAVSAWSAGAWTLAAAGSPLLGAGLAVATTAALAPRLEGLRHPWREAARLAGGGHLHAGRSMAEALRRSWWPLALAGALVSRRARTAAVAAATVPLLAEWAEQRPALDPLRWMIIRLADDLAYGAGLWAGCARQRSLAALRPDLSSWPGRRHAVEAPPQPQDGA